MAKSKEEKALIILEALSDYIQVDWNFEKIYIKGIVQGLEKIENPYTESYDDDELIDEQNKFGYRG